MTAHFVPPVATLAKPLRVNPVFAKVGRRALADVPGKKGMPLLGILPEAVLDPQAFTRRMLERYGPVHRFYACGNWNLQLVGPEANELLLFDQTDLFSSRGGWAPVFGRHFDGGLLLRDGDDHQWHRKVIAAAFKQEQLQNYLDVFSSNIAAVLPSWFGRTRDAYEMAQLLTFRNGYEAFLGRDATAATRDDLLAFRYLMRSATAVLPFALPGSAHGRATWARRHVERLILPMLDEPVVPERRDLLAYLTRMRDAGTLDAGEIVSHLMFVIAASYDTLSSGTVSTLYYLAANPEWQARVRAELCDKVADTDAIALTDLQACEASERVIKEALRLNAAAPVLWRRANRDFSFKGVDVPGGTVVGINPMLTHLLPEIWPEPKRFDPDRFLPEESRARHRFAFVPFGGGAHGCIGANFAFLQIRTVLRHILQGHEIRLADTAAPRWYHWPNCRPRRRLSLELRPFA